MLDINERIERLESLEPDAEDAVRKKEYLEQQGEELLKSLQELSHDIEVSGIVKEYSRENQEERQENAAVINGLREEVQRIENELSEFIEMTNDSLRKTEELSALDIDVREALAVLDERKVLINECTVKLEELIQMLNMAEFNAHSESGNEAAGAKQSEEENWKFKPISSAGGNNPPSSEYYFVKALIRGPLLNGYTDILWNRYDNGKENVRRLFNNLSELIEVKTTTNQDGNYYLSKGVSENDMGIYMNAAEDAFNKRGAGTTFWHETGHMVDHAAKGFQGWLSDDRSFHNALIKDVNHFLWYYNQRTPEEQRAFTGYLFSGSGHSLSDLLDGLTGGRIKGGWGHERSYWSEPGAVEKEAFAHFFEASMGGGGKLDMLRAVFPESLSEFYRLIDDGNSDFHVLKLQKTLKK